ncbi:flagellin N-terminal helical domain-containing protein [Herbiconiux sp. SYSU D00978]|uniref:flagellin N-terminal helical domain-containing protein n=1 Tax=Herbiconiux sp. SYSU D00978 TaxID=2812562 RepID=UPI001A97599D|nr:flagellin [Herbiconiux sp. SYSU D00978]
MGMQINTNVAALNSYRNLSNTQNDLSKSLEKLSSGLRINRAADDAAGLAISEGLRSQVSGLNQAARNAQDGISVIQTAEGGLTEVHTILQRMRDLAVQAGNDSNNEQSREAITAEVTALTEELTRIGETTNFNGIYLLAGDTDGAAGAVNGTSLSFQVGAGADESNQITINLTGADVDTVVTGLNGVDLTTAGGAADSIALIDAQITAVSAARGDLGAVQNRFESAIRSLQVSSENLSAAGSRIRDTDMASEMVKFTRANILSQAGTAMLAQANQSNQGVLQLLG